MVYLGFILLIIGAFYIGKVFKRRNKTKNFVIAIKPPSAASQISRQIISEVGKQMQRAK